MEPLTLTDEYQTQNLYRTLSKAQQNELHAMIMSYGQCKGTQCW